MVSFGYRCNIGSKSSKVISTVYKTLATLEELALAEVDKYIISSEGKKIKLYRSRIGKVEITLDDLEPILHLYPNETTTQ